jgi:hypothetical protein
MHVRSTACCRSTARTSSCCAIRLRRRISTTRQSSPRSTTPNASRWRPIAGPLLRSPLALRDAETLEAENLYPDRTGETYAITYNPNQRGRSYGQDLRDTMSVAIDRGLDPKAGSTGIHGERTVALQYVDDVAKPRRDDANASRAWMWSFTALNSFRLGFVLFRQNGHRITERFFGKQCCQPTQVRGLSPQGRWIHLRQDPRSHHRRPRS